MHTACVSDILVSRNQTLSGEERFDWLCETSGIHVCVLVYHYPYIYFSHQSSVGGAVNHVIPFSDQELPFVEQPSNDFFCPVTYGLLLHPHLTECCGKHLSREVVNRIRREGRACPLCNKQPFHTMLNQHFRRQVRELRVFCCHEDSECAWQGGLFDMEKHVRSCGMSDTPLKLDLLKL